MPLFPLSYVWHNEHVAVEEDSRHHEDETYVIKSCSNFGQIIAQIIQTVIPSIKAKLPFTEFV